MIVLALMVAPKHRCASQHTLTLILIAYDRAFKFVTNQYKLSLVPAKYTSQKWSYINLNMIAYACTTKQLSSLLTSCFKTILIHYKQYCDGIYSHSGVNCFWIINNSTEVLDRLHQINKTSRARKFDSYDFATLYTNIPHNALKNNIRSLVREAFKIRGAKYIIVDRHGNGHWSLESALSTASVSVSKSKLVE